MRDTGAELDMLTTVEAADSRYEVEAADNHCEVVEAGKSCEAEGVAEGKRHEEERDG